MVWCWLSRWVHVALARRWRLSPQGEGDELTEALACVQRLAKELAALQCAAGWGESLRAAEERLRLARAEVRAIRRRRVASCPG
jgi:hypothetical protein